MEKNSEEQEPYTARNKKPAKFSENSEKDPKENLTKERENDKYDRANDKRDRGKAEKYSTNEIGTRKDRNQRDKDITPKRRNRERYYSNSKLNKSPVIQDERISNRSLDKSSKYQEVQNPPEDIWLKERGRFDQTEFSINDRFSALSISGVPLKIEDNISVEIERNIRGKEPFCIPRKIDYSLVDIVRHPSDDTRFLMMRETFDIFKDLIDHDKRIIKVHQKDDDTNFDLPLDYSKTNKRRVNMNQKSDKSSIEYRLGPKDKRAGNQGTDQRQYRDVEREDHWRLRQNRDANDSKNSGQDRRNMQPIEKKIEKRRFTEKPPEKELTELSHGGRRKVETREEDRPKWRTTVKTSLVKDRLGSRTGHEPEEPTNKIRRLQPDGEIMEVDKSVVNALPDFSKRPDKYTYEPWKNKPELIPRGASYFEHDTRDDEDDRWRPRGSQRDGRYSRRGFGGPRGGRFNRPYNPQSRNRIFEEWKHDKFEELQDNSLTSTTEK